MEHDEDEILSFLIQEETFTKKFSIEDEINALSDDETIEFLAPIAAEDSNIVEHEVHLDAETDEWDWKLDQPVYRRNVKDNNHVDAGLLEVDTNQENSSNAADNLSETSLQKEFYHTANGSRVDVQLSWSQLQEWNVASKQAELDIDIEMDADTTIE